MLTQDKKEQFFSIARELYTREFLGVDGYGIDKEYEDELTKVSGEYLISIFYNKNKVGEAKEELMNVMSKKQPTHTSNLLNIML